MANCGLTISIMLACAKSTFPFSFTAGLLLFFLPMAPNPASGVSLHLMHLHESTESCGEGLAALEAKLKMMYQSLPQNAQGLPEASAIRYMARRYLTVEHGWILKGLDMTPLHKTQNMTEYATHRAAQIVRVPQGLPQADHEALSVVLTSNIGRGFSLCEAARVVSALEQVVSNGELSLLRMAHSLSKQMKDDGGSPPMYRVLENYAALHFAGTTVQDSFATGTMSNEDANKRLAREVKLLKEDLKHDLDGEALEVTVQAAAKDAFAGGKKRGGSGAMKGMQRLRARLNERQAGECRKYRNLLASLDTEGTGQVQYATVYGMQVKGWAMYETPEYLRAVGAFEDEGAHGKGPGVLIPNYVVSMNSCREPDQRDTVMCCPDECEATILSRVEVVAAGPRATVEQVWSAVYQLLMEESVVPAHLKKTFHSKLVALASRSKDGRIEVHGDGLGTWLHHAFPHTCPKPAPHRVMPVVDTKLFLSEWKAFGRHVPVEAEEVAVIKEHLASRWGPDGTGAQAGCFAMRSTLGLDAEILLIHEILSKRQKNDPPVLNELDNILNAWALEPTGGPNMHMLAMLAATGTLGQLALLYVLANALGIFGMVHALAYVAMTAVAASAWKSAQFASLCRDASTTLLTMPGNFCAACRRVLTAVGTACRKVITKFMVVFSATFTQHCIWLKGKIVLVVVALVATPNAAREFALAIWIRLRAGYTWLMATLIACVHQLTQAFIGAEMAVVDAMCSCTRCAAILKETVVYNVDKLQVRFRGWDWVPTREQGVPIWVGASIAALIASLGAYAGAGDDEGAGIELATMGVLVVVAIVLDRFNVFRNIYEAKPKLLKEQREVNDRTICSKNRPPHDFGAKENPLIASAPWRAPRGGPCLPVQRGAYWNQQPTADKLHRARPSQSIRAPAEPTSAPPPGLETPTQSQSKVVTTMTRATARPVPEALIAPARLSGPVDPPGLKLAPRWMQPQPRPEPVATSGKEAGSAGGVTSNGGCLTEKRSLLLDLLLEEKRRTPDSLTEKSRLLLEVLCEEELNTRQTARESQIDRPMRRAPPGLSLGPPPGLPAPPGFDGLMVA